MLLVEEFKMMLPMVEFHCTIEHAKHVDRG
jgi:hypothetical protein